jgi:hypothetical protein
MTEDPRLLSTVEIEAIGKSAAHCVLRQHYSLLGYNIDDSDDVKALQQDFAFMRGSRFRFNSMSTWIARTITTVFVVGFMAALAGGLREIFSKGG